jgi:arylsulfatase A-like enzyme
MTSAAKPVNFLLFITDQHRADHLGSYGNRVVHTPNLDRLAESGWRADNMHVATPICMPNRASLMTGRYPSAHGARHNGIALSLRSRTFVEAMREAGYGTSLVGKVHLQNMTDIPPSWPVRGGRARPRPLRPGAAQAVARTPRPRSELSVLRLRAGGPGRRP